MMCNVYNNVYMSYAKHIGYGECITVGYTISRLSWM